MDDWSKAFARKHAIHKDVWRERGYYRYAKGDPEGLLRKAWPKDKANADFADFITEQQPALIIPRYAPPIDGIDERIYAEIRPEHEVQMGLHPHYHDRLPPTEEERAKVMSWPDAKMSWISDSWTMRRHIRKPRELRGHDGNWRQNYGVHMKIKMAKYIFPKGATYAKRIDMLRIAWDLLEDAERVYFVIEGCIKADSVLSAILRTGERATVLSVPSVTLWPFEDEDLDGDQHQLLPRYQDAFTSELERVSEALLCDKEIIIVPDKDWTMNALVYGQTMQIQTLFRDRDFNAHVAAPPLRKGAKKDKRGKLLSNGVDDFLARRGKLANLVARDRPVPILDVFVRDQWSKAGKRINQYAARQLRALAVHSGLEIADDGKTPIWTEDGIFSFSASKSGKLLGVQERTAQQTLVDLRKLPDDAFKLIGGNEWVDEHWARGGKRLEEEPELKANGRPVENDIYRCYGYWQQPVYRLREDLRPGPLSPPVKIGKPGSLKPPPTKADVDRMLRDDFSDKMLRDGKYVSLPAEEFDALPFPQVSPSESKQIRIGIAEHALDLGFPVATVAKMVDLGEPRIRQIKRALEHKHMNIETNERLTRIEAQQGEILAVVTETLSRVCGRFPEDADVQAAVEQFIASALSQESAAA